MIAHRTLRILAPTTDVRLADDVLEQWGSPRLGAPLHVSAIRNSPDVVCERVSPRQPKYSVRLGCALALHWPCHVI